MARGLAEGARGLSEKPVQRVEARRVRAWTVLANLFLDTWFDDEQYLRFARSLGDTGYTSSELEFMLTKEIAPVFGINLLSVAGEWELWGEAEVEQLATSAMRADGTMPLGKRLLGRWGERVARPDWTRLKALVEAEIGET